jgi:hypothetical protein
MRESQTAPPQILPVAVTSPLSLFRKGAASSRAARLIKWIAALPLAEKLRKAPGDRGRAALQRRVERSTSARALAPVGRFCARSEFFRGLFSR